MQLSPERTEDTVGTGRRPCPDVPQRGVQGGWWAGPAHMASCARPGSQQKDAECERRWRERGGTTPRSGGDGTLKEQKGRDAQTHRELRSLQVEGTSHLRT